MAATRPEASTAGAEAMAPAAAPMGKTVSLPAAPPKRGGRDLALRLPGALLLACAGALYGRGYGE